MKTRIVNIQRFSLHDGPGIRTVVFLKGCSLRCLWCANPECINPFPELGFSKLQCNKCGNCFSACPEKALTPDKDRAPEIDRSCCTNCGQCVSVCPQKALTIYGREYTLEKVLEEVVRDRSFYDHSGGGVTVSGGEPILQADFVVELFKQCKEAQIATAIETGGNVSPESLKKVLECTDCILFDLKSLDNQRHKKLTGQPNDLILKNAHMIARRNIPCQFRMPLIPGLNDDSENIRQTSEFLHQLSTFSNHFSIELMPYHRLGIGKYEALGRDYALKEIAVAGPEVIDSVKNQFEELGISCLVSS